MRRIEPWLENETPMRAMARSLGPLGFGASVIPLQRLLGLNSQWLYRSPDWQHRRCWHFQAGFRLGGRSHGAPHFRALCFLFVELLGEVREANFFIAHALGHNAIVKRNARMSAAQFAHHKRSARFLG